jgi:hypothetical protein
MAQKKTIKVQLATAKELEQAVATLIKIRDDFDESVGSIYNKAQDAITKGYALKKAIMEVASYMNGMEKSLKELGLPLNTVPSYVDADIELDDTMPMAEIDAIMKQLQNIPR